MLAFCNGTKYRIQIEHEAGSMVIEPQETKELKTSVNEFKILFFNENFNFYQDTIDSKVLQSGQNLHLLVSEGGVEFRHYIPDYLRVVTGGLIKGSPIPTPILAPILLTNPFSWVFAVPILANQVISILPPVAYHEFQQPSNEVFKITSSISMIEIHRERQRAEELEHQREAERQRAEELERQREAERRRAEELERQRKAERQRAEELERQREVERQRAEEWRRQREAEQQRRVEELKRQREAEQRAAEEERQKSEAREKILKDILSMLEIVKSSAGVGFQLLQYLGDNLTYIVKVGSKKAMKVGYAGSKNIYRGFQVTLSLTPGLIALGVHSGQKTLSTLKTATPWLKHGFNRGMLMGYNASKNLFNGLYSAATLASSWAKSRTPKTVVMESKISQSVHSDLTLASTLDLKRTTPSLVEDDNIDIEEIAMRSVASLRLKKNQPKLSNTQSSSAIIMLSRPSL